VPRMKLLKNLFAAILPRKKKQKQDASIYPMF
jgi:hypothetical protein